MKYKNHKPSILIIIVFLLSFYSPSENLQTVLNLNHGIVLAKANSSIDPNMVWHQTYGEGGGGCEYAYSLIQTKDGGFALTGSADHSDIWFLKTDENGTEEWHQRYGGDLEDEGYSVIQTMDNGYAILGYTYSYGSGITDMWLIKTDEVGTIEWEKTYGGSTTEKGYTVVQTKDEGFLLSGYCNILHHIWLVKTNKEGEIEIEWHHDNISFPYHTSYVNRKGPMIQTTDQGFAIAGYAQTENKTGADVLIIKGSMNGTVEYMQSYGTLKDDLPTAMIQTQDEGFVITGYIANPPYEEPFLLKIDKNGTERWFESYGRSRLEITYSVVQTNDGGFALAGITSTSPYPIDKDMLLIRTNDVGKHLWNKTLGGKKSDGAYSLVQTSDDCFVLGGYTDSYGNWDFWLVKTSDAPPLSIKSPPWITGFETMLFLIVLAIIVRKKKMKK